MTKLFIVERGADGLLRPIDWPDRAWKTWLTQDLPIGAMWRCECHDQEGWMIRIPGYAAFGERRYVNLWCTLAESDTGARWDVSGEAPNLTVTPSIHAQPNEGAPREWHGWITNGELVDA